MYEYKAKLMRWIDGDTVVISIDLGFFSFRTERVRLARINAWEVKDTSAYRRRWARSARFQAKKICPEGSEVIIQTSKNPKRDMYDRYIAEIVFKNKNLSDELLKLKGVDAF